MRDNTGMAVKILYFAWLREKTGIAAEEIALPPGIATVAALMAWMQGRNAGFAAAFADPGLVRCAVDQEFRPASAGIAGAAEIAFFPPVTGG
jgi:molybdopterin synthase sulfur carrier subunit